MPKNETGEFELVLGNRQLLSGFAVVVILLGVFFAMGYIVGRNSMPSSRAASAQDTPITVPPPDSARGQTTPPPTTPVTAATTEAANATPPPPPPAVDATPAPTTQPARAPEAARSVEKPPEPAPAGVQPAESLPPGTYLQVIATIKSDAEVISKSLQDRRFPAVITPSSLEGRFRVVVGPYKDSAAVGAAKTELENLGFHPIAVKMAQ
jgi:cell division protein FtsN